MLVNKTGVNLQAISLGLPCWTLARTISYRPFLNSISDLLYVVLISQNKVQKIPIEMEVLSSVTHYDINTYLSCLDLSGLV